MKTTYTLAILLLSFNISIAQNFVRTELSTKLNTPWEITYGPDNFLWLTEYGGQISRIDPSSGDKTIIYIAADYFDGAPSERSILCHQPRIGKGTLGLALHPDFDDPDNAYIYFVYSYNSGTTDTPATKFKVRRLLWDYNNNEVIESQDIITLLPSGYDHLGGRLLSARIKGTPYLFLSIGDLGVSEQNSLDCYTDQSQNPNNFAQNLSTLNGKVHRFNMDGSIPNDNPIKGNSFYTRGHRNPQGLMFNPNTETLYDVEHGVRTYDEINRLEKGMNYGWKAIRGYHDDNSYPGELEYYNNYTPSILIENDRLIPPIYSWCTVADQAPVSPSSGRCTVAPSDGIYYNSRSIPEWTNSLLVVTLKNGNETDREVYQFGLDKYGNIKPNTSNNKVSQKKFFGEDQALNGRLRDIAVSPDGTKIYLINNGGTDRDKITVYTYLGTGPRQNINPDIFLICPNPVQDNLFMPNLDLIHDFKKLEIHSSLGQIIYQSHVITRNIEVSNFRSGAYFISVHYQTSIETIKFIKL